MGAPRFTLIHVGLHFDEVWRENLRRTKLLWMTLTVLKTLLMTTMSKYYMHIHNIYSMALDLWWVVTTEVAADNNLTLLSLLASFVDLMQAFDV